MVAKMLPLQRRKLFQSDSGVSLGRGCCHPLHRPVRLPRHVAIFGWMGPESSCRQSRVIFFRRLKGTRIDCCFRPGRDGQVFVWMTLDRPDRPLVLKIPMAARASLPAIESLFTPHCRCLRHRAGLGLPCRGPDRTSGSKVKVMNRQISTPERLMENASSGSRR